MAEAESQHHFKRYDKSFQEKVYHALLTDKEWATQMFEVMTPDYFEVKYLRYLTELYFAHFKSHRVFPTQSLIASLVKENLREGSDVILRDQIVDYLTRIRQTPDLCDLPKVKEMTLEFCRKQAIKEALCKAVDLTEVGKTEEIVEVIKSAVVVGIPTSVGHDFKEDFEARFQKIDRRPVPTGIQALDELLNGGLGKGELGTVVAATGSGKSHFLVNVGAHAVKMGKNVVHYTLELSETAVGIRYDSWFCNIPSNEIQDNKEAVAELYKREEMGGLIIKEYPTGFPTVNTLRAHLEKLVMRNFKPHLILIDYADIMRSTHRYDSLRHELKLIYEEVRNLAHDFALPIWTASQGNRESANADVIGMENMSEAYGKAMVADVVVSLSRKPAEKSIGTGRLFIAKNRAGRDGVLFNIKIDTARSKFTISEEDAEEIPLGEALSTASKETKNNLRDAWRKLQGENN